MRPLTARQQEVLELLKRHLETTGMPPTRAERWRLQQLFSSHKSAVNFFHIFACSS